METKEYGISWTWNNITLSLWILIDVKIWRTVGLNNMVKDKNNVNGGHVERTK